MVSPPPHQQEAAVGSVAIRRHAWLALESQFIRNRKTGVPHIDASFCNFIQGDLNMNDYCRMMKGFARLSFLSQRQYVVDLLQRAGMSNCHSTTTPSTHMLSSLPTLVTLC